MKKRELVKRSVWMVIGLFLSGLGVAFTRHGELGVSPISSVANVLSIRFAFLTLGNWLIIWNIILIAGQILILRKHFRMIQLLQIPLSFLFGWFTDIGMRIVAGIPVERYPVRLLMVLIGTAILGLGISLAVIADVIMNSGEAFVKAVADTRHREFGNVKMAFDISCVALALLLSLLLFHVRIVGTREGTILAALLTGVTVRFFDRRLRTPLEKHLRGAV